MRYETLRFSTYSCGHDVPEAFDVILSFLKLLRYTRKEGRKEGKESGRADGWTMKTDVRLARSLNRVTHVFVPCPNPTLRYCNQ